MGKDFLQNHFIVGFLLTVIGSAIGFGIGIVLELLSVSVSSSNAAASLGALIIAASILGNNYAKKHKKPMPKELRLKSSVVYFVLQSIVSYLILLLFPEMWTVLGAPILIAILILAGVVFSFVAYWFLGYFGKKYLEHQKKK